MIIPAILENTVDRFAEKIAQIQTIPGVKRVQVDFCDGVFVKNNTLHIHDFAFIGTLPKKYTWEAHLMVKSPQSFVSYKEAGFKLIILHYEAFENETELERAIDEVLAHGLQVGLAINPETPVTVLRYYADNIMNFTVMSVHPGFQGSSFLLGSVDKVKELREIAKNATIEVDGGIKKEYILALLEAGADNLAVGSALFETENIKQNYQTLETARITIQSQ